MANGKGGDGAVEKPAGSSILSDLKSGFMVFLIALPLCLGIAAASGCPPIAGVYTAIAGGIITTFLSNSQLTIKGPAAGLIVIVVGCVNEFKTLYTDHPDMLPSGVTDPALAAYYATLAVCVVSGVLQIVFGALKGGVLGDFFPSSAVHGLLASIGVIIIAKQIPVALGIGGASLWEPGTTHEYAEPLFLILNLPRIIWQHIDPQYAAIGVVGLLIMFGMPAMSQKLVKIIPAQVVVLLVTIPLAIFVLGIPHPALNIFGQEILPAKTAAPPPEVKPAEPTPAVTDGEKKAEQSGKEGTQPAKADVAHGDGHAPSSKPAATKPPPKYKPLVIVPPDPNKSGDKDVLGQLKERLTDLTQGKFYPNFSALKHGFAWKWIALFCIIGSLESLLSAKAVDMLDPLKRKTDLNRDLLAVGVANTFVAFFGGIPMIAEIVRSRANIDNGAQSKFSDMFHGLFLLLAVITIPMVLNLIPLAAGVPDALRRAGRNT